MQEVKKQAEAGTKETKEAIAALDERLKRVESGWALTISMMLYWDCVTWAQHT